MSASVISGPVHFRRPRSIVPLAVSGLAFGAVLTAGLIVLRSGGDNEAVEGAPASPAAASVVAPPAPSPEVKVEPQAPAAVDVAPSASPSASAPSSSVANASVASTSGASRSSPPRPKATTVTPPKKKREGLF